MTQKTIKVGITYQRSVVVGAEQALLRDILVDVGRLKQDTAFGNAYRQVYSDKSGINPEDAKKLLAQGKTILIVPGEAKDNANVQSRIVTPQELANILNDAVLTQKVPESSRPLDENGNPRPFEEKDVILDAKGQWPKIDKTGRTAQPVVQNPRVLGSTPVQMTPDDLDKIQRLQSDAETLGITPDELVRMYALQASPAALARGGRIEVSWSGDEIGDSSGLLKGTSDELRFRAQRPGGENYVPDPTREIFSDPSVEQYFPDEALAAIRPPGDPVYDMSHSRTANLQKLDNYAVLRVISGFTPAAGDLLAPSKRSSDFRVLFATNRFLVQDVQESQAERVALVETFGETLLYVFGERPRMYSYSGTLMDTQGLNWLNEWREAYRTKFRATATLKLKARVFLIYRDVAREGIIVANANSLSVAELGTGRFSFQMFVMKEYFLDGRPKIDDQVDAPTGLESTPVDPEEPIYVLSSLQDVTVDPEVPASSDRTPGAARLRATIAANEKVIDLRRAEIEARIRKDAFQGDRYVQSSGSFSLKLEESDATLAVANYNTRLYGESYAPPEVTVVEAR